MLNLDRFFPMSLELILMTINPIHDGISKARSKKSVQSALNDLKRLPELLQSQCDYRPFRNKAKRNGKW